MKDKRRRSIRIFAAVVAFALIAALVCTYVLSFGAFAEEDLENLEGGGGNYEVAVDENGNPIYDENGNPVLATNSSKPSIRISAYPDSMRVGDVERLSYELTNIPADTSVYWESSDPDVASVNEKGEVTAIAPGDVWVKAVAGEYTSQEISIKIENPEPTGVVIKFSNFEETSADKGTFELIAGDVLRVSYELLPEGALSNAAAVWELSDTEVASFDETKSEITALSEGETELRLTVGELSAKVSLQVSESKGAFWDYIDRMFPFVVLAIIVVVAAVLALLLIILSGRRKKKARKASNKSNGDDKRDVIARSEATRQSSDSNNVQRRGGEARQSTAPPPSAPELKPRIPETDAPIAGSSVGIERKLGDTIHSARKDDTQAFTLDDIED